jgi:hypothetical protein
MSWTKGFLVVSRVNGESTPESFYRTGENGAQMRPLVALLAALLLVGSAGAAASTFQSDDYSMSSPEEVEIPARSLTVDGTDYTVRGIGRVAPGDRIRVDVTAPEDAEYSVYLYNKDLRVEQTDSMSGSGRATFSTGNLSPGSYLAAVYDGEILDVYPVVVEGYEVTVESPATADSSFDVNVSVADGALTRDPAQVQVVLGDDDRSVRVDATRVEDGEYRATLPTDGFEPGTYALYGVVRGEEETEGGDRVILAVGDRYEIQLEAATPTPTVTPGSGGGGDGGGGGGGQSGEGDDGEVTVEGTELLNGTVSTAEPVVVRVDLANFDPARGEATLRLTTDGTVLAERTVSVGASSERTVYLRAVLDTAGTYPLSLNGDSLGSLTVTAAPTESPTDAAAPTETPTPTRSPTPTDEAVVTPRPTTASSTPPATTTSGDGAGFGVAAATLAVAFAALALGRRR